MKGAPTSYGAPRAFFVRRAQRRDCVPQRVPRAQPRGSVPRRMPRAHAWLRTTAGVLAAAGLLLATGAAGAHPPSFAERHPDLKRPLEAKQTAAEQAATTERARELFRLGVVAVAAKDYVGCERDFAEAWVLKGSPGTLVNLAVCERELGYFVDAAEHLREAIYRLNPSDEAQAKLLKDAKESYRVVRQAVGTLEVQSAPAGATLTITPKPSPPTGGPASAGMAGRTFTAPADEIFLYAGDYTLRVRTLAGEEQVTDVHIVAGEGVVKLFRPEEPANAPRSLPILFAGIGSSVVFLGTGIGLLAASQARLTDADKLRPRIGALFGSETGGCYAPTGPRVALCKQLDAATDDGALFEDLGIAAFVATGIVAAGTTAYALWPRSAPTATVTATTMAPGVARLQLSPVAGPTGGGLLLQGSW